MKNATKKILFEILSIIPYGNSLQSSDRQENYLFFVIGNCCMSHIDGEIKLDNSLCASCASWTCIWLWEYSR